MVYNSRILALIIAISVAFITSFALMFFNETTTTMLLVAFGLSFLMSFILVFVMLEVLIFREINKIYQLMDKLGKKQLNKLSKQKGAFNPLEKINEEIFSFARLKEKEIDELKKLEVFRKEFIADVSHELKTPIFAAQGFVHTLLDGAIDDKAVRTSFLKKAAKSLDGLDALVQDLLTLSHIETGQIKMQFESIDLYKLTQDVFEQLEEKAAKQNIILTLEAAKSKVIAYADAQRIFQVMTNLVSNAIKHSFPGGTINVTFERSKKYITTHIVDHGEGIPAEHIGRIFERFYRVDKSRSREKGGTGLGLAIVKHILENHNSKINVNSTPGKGSDFWFKLPRTKQYAKG